jgi:streptomycin 6-kinase
MVNQSPLETAISRSMIRWSLTKWTPVAESERSWVVRVEQNGRNFAALKILKPIALEDEGRGAELQRWYGGEGAATVFDVHGNVVFMEWLDGVTLADPVRKGHDQESAIAIATLVGQLHRQRPEPAPPLTDLQATFQPLFNADLRAWPFTARDLFARACGIALKLFDRPSPQVPLHGDLQHDNILLSERGWLAIDPQGLIGDPAFEVANVFRNPDGADKLVTDPRRIAMLADVFSQRLGLQRKRMLGFAAAHAALCACRDLSAGKPITADLAVLAPLLAAYDLA